jgi:hypothetical protein
MLMRRVFVSEFDLSDAYLAELKDLGVRVALRNEDGSFLYCGVLMQTFPAKATCFVVREDVIDEAVLKATAAVIWIGKARKASEKLDLVPLPSAAQVGAEVFDLAFASIYTGGPKRWTVGQEVDWERQIGALKEFGLDCADVVIPFAGDVPFAAHASARSVTVVEWSKVALDKLKTRFPEQKVPDNVHLIQAEWFSWAEKIEAGRFSLAFDKDAFGFCNPDSRTKYAESVSRLVSIFFFLCCCFSFFFFFF